VDLEEVDNKTLVLYTWRLQNEETRPLNEWSEDISDHRSSNTIPFDSFDYASMNLDDELV